MNLTLIRTKLDSAATEGELLVDGQQQFYTLELPVKDGLPGSAIQPGTYPVEMLPSPKFERSTDAWVLKYAGSIPHVCIRNRSNILIHWGNSAADTEGCILVGMAQGEDFVSRSREAFETLWAYLMAANGRGEAIQIEVRGGIPMLNNFENVADAANPD